MDSASKVMIVTVGATMVTMVAKIIRDGIIRHAELQREELGLGRSQIEQRLERIEIAVDAIAIEVERAGELQRFTAQLSQPKLPTSAPPPARVVTPH